MDDAHLCHAGAPCVVEILVQKEAGIVRIVAAQVKLGAERRNRLVPRAFYRHLSAVFIGKSHLHAVDEHEIFRIRFRFDDPRLHGHIPALIGIGEQDSLLSDVYKNHLVALFQGTRQDVALHGFRIDGIELVAVLLQMEPDVAARLLQRLCEILAFALAPYLFQLRKDIFARGFCALHHAHGSGARLFQLLFRFALALCDKFVHFGFFRARRGEKRFRLRFCLFHHDALRLQPFDHGLKASVFSGNIALRPSDDRIRQSELAGNRKRIGFAGRPDDEPIGRTQGFHVKFAGGVAHALGIERIGFELRIVRRRGAESALFPDGFENGNGKRRPLHRIRARSHLVEKDERAAVGAP